MGVGYVSHYVTAAEEMLYVHGVIISPTEYFGVTLINIIPGRKSDGLT